MREFSISLNNLGACLWVQFEGNGLLETLKEAVAIRQQAVDLSQTTDSARSLMLAELAGEYIMLYLYLGKIDDITPAVHLGKEAIGVVGLYVL
ncbi:hypothetical protein F5Y02DRAFT_226248 [Annulohypoxylon stygium]|nr:hypothetical protein F5Y02DRAFT_226248 [Annulohypoxylon stygium]